MAISTRVSEVFNLFGVLQRQIDEPERCFTYMQENTALQEELGRFRIWTGNIGAHRTGRSSLDFRLRDAPKLEQKALGLIGDLKETLEEVTSVVSGSKQPWDDDFENESDDNSIFQPPFLTEKGHPPLKNEDIEEDIASPFTSPNEIRMAKTEMEQLLLDVAEIITCLMRFSMTIRQPISHAKFSRAAGIDKSGFEPFDLNHVREKFPSADDQITLRIGRAITARRRYLAYRESHQEKLRHGLIANMRGEMTTTDDEDAQTLQHPLSTIASSLPDKFKNVDIEADYDTGSEAGNSETSFASSTDENLQLSPPPLPPEALTEHPYPCPICYMIIDIHTTVSWRRHVFKDLHPYVCTSLDCTTPDRLFERRSEWFNHELQLHRRMWQCLHGCSQNFASKAEFSSHLRLAHVEIFDETQLPALMEMSETAKPWDEEDDCPLCYERQKSLKQLRRHLGRHQEQLALFALPMSVKEGEDMNQENSEDDARSNNTNETGHLSKQSNRTASEHGERNDEVTDANPFQTQFITPSRKPILSRMDEDEELGTSKEEDIESNDSWNYVADPETRPRGAESEPDTEESNIRIEERREMEASGSDRISRSPGDSPLPHRRPQRRRPQSVHSNSLDDHDDYPGGPPESSVPKLDGLVPNCAICNGPAYPECPFESERLQIAFQQAGNRFIMKAIKSGTIQTDSPASIAIPDHVRDFVVDGARPRVLNLFESRVSKFKQEHARYVYSLPHYNPLSHPTLGGDSEAKVQAAYQELRRNINLEWRSCILLYPELFDYFFDKVQVSTLQQEDLHGTSKPNISTVTWEVPREKTLQVRPYNATLGNPLASSSKDNDKTGQHAEHLPLAPSHEDSDKQRKHVQHVPAAKAGNFYLETEEPEQGA